MANPDPFIPSVLRSSKGTIAIQVNPASMLLGGSRIYYRLVHLGPDGIELLDSMKMPLQPGAMVELTALRHTLVTSFTELQPPDGQVCRYDHD
jgi:hypothetical protein